MSALTFFFWRGDLHKNPGGVCGLSWGSGGTREGSG